LGWRRPGARRGSACGGVGPGEALLPVYLEQRFRATEAFGLLVACAGLGAVGGALLTGLVRPVRRGRWAYSGGLLSALALAGYAVAGQVWQLALLAFVWDVGIEAFQVIWDTSVQELVRPERSAGVRPGRAGRGRPDVRGVPGPGRAGLPRASARRRRAPGRPSAYACWRPRADSEVRA
jgi:hypothetical protein